MAKDRFKINLECPKCGKIGTADALEEEGWAYMKGNRGTTISSLPDGFKVVRHKSSMANVDIRCKECGISAVK